MIKLKKIHLLHKPLASSKRGNDSTKRVNCECDRVVDEIWNTRTRGNFHVRIKLRAVFGYAEDQ